jgi:hypothetical protein
MNSAFRAAADGLMAQLPGLSVEWGGGMSPFQAEGTLYGQPFYFRFRHNTAVLRVGGDLHFKALYVAATEYGASEDQGWLDPAAFVALMRQLIPALQRAEIYWEFPGIQPRDVGVLEAGTPVMYGAWGHTPEQAWEQLNQPSNYLTSVGIDEATQAAMRAEQQLCPQTVTVDDRVFPNPDPFEMGSPA